MSNANTQPVVAAFSGTGKLTYAMSEARREIRADGSLWLIFGENPEPKKEIVASATDEATIEASEDFIAEGMLTDHEVAELDEHNAVAIGPELYTYWKTDRQGLRWLKRVEAEATTGRVSRNDQGEAGPTPIAATEPMLALYYDILEKRAAGEDIDPVVGDTALRLAGKSMDDFNADITELIRLDMELGNDD